MGTVRGVIYGAVSMSASQGSCRVQRVVERGRGSWTVIGTDRRPVQAADRYLAWLTSIERVAEHGAGLRVRLEAVLRVPGVPARWRGIE